MKQMKHFTSTFELPENDFQLNGFPFEDLPDGACVVAMCGIDLENPMLEYDPKSGQFIWPVKIYGDSEAAKTAEQADIRYGSENYNILFYVTDRPGEFSWVLADEEVARLSS